MTRTEFENLVHQLGRKLYSFAFRILRNQEEAEDTVQEVFIKLWKMKESLNEYQSIDALAVTMTKNFCIDLLRKSKHFNIVQGNDNDYQQFTSQSPQEQLELRESDNIIRSLIDNLPDIYKVVIKLRDIDGLSYEEIAEKTGQNINTIRVTLSRARGFIRVEYKKYHDEHRGIRQTTR
jgi:RNA polymerase sigma factor (sigma-70 family)